MLRGRISKLVGIGVGLAMASVPLAWLAAPVSASTTFSDTSSISLANPKVGRPTRRDLPLAHFRLRPDRHD